MKDRERKLFILRVVLIGGILLAVVAVIVNAITKDQSDESVIEFLPGFVLGVLLLLYSLVKKGFLVIPSLVLVGLLSLPAYYLSFRYGTMIPQGWILFALTIIMSGILIGSTCALLLTVLHGSLLLLLTYLQIIGEVKYQTWDQTPMLGSIIVAIATFLVIGIISWLSNREIEKALQQARASEKALQKERDLLEIKVEKRTQELQKIQLEKIIQIYRFADFGKLAAGLFHDLVTPLNVVSLNLENLKEETAHDTSKNIEEIRRVLRHAIYSTKGIEKFVKNTRLQLQGQQTKSYFNLVHEIDNALEGLADQASKAGVKLDFSGRNTVHTFGNPFRFHQIVVNLVSNAIDSYINIKRKSNRVIHIILFHKDNLIVFKVEDFGIGISHHTLSHIFDPFYTTKPIEEGIGIGLTICKDIAEKDFGGSVTVKSQPQKGTIFRVQFPRKKLNYAQEHI
jgi:signal transduction histidine kinase